MEIIKRKCRSIFFLKKKEPEVINEFNSSLTSMKIFTPIRKKTYEHEKINKNDGNLSINDLVNSL